MSAPQVTRAARLAASTSLLLAPSTAPTAFVETFPHSLMILALFHELYRRSDQRWHEHE
jgi:hypothetical protein